MRGVLFLLGQVLCETLPEVFVKWIPFVIPFYKDIRTRISNLIPLNKETLKMILYM